MSNSDNLFSGFEAGLKDAVANVPEQEKIQAEADERLLVWKQKRIGKITSSELPKLMNRKKNGGIGKTGTDYLLEVMHQRQTGADEQQTFAKAFEWGHQYEEEALEYYNSVTKQECISGTYGDGPILFRTPLYGFGDSPDGVTPDNEGVVEIKCPINAANHLRNCALTAYHDKLDYFWQLIGHMIDPCVKWVDFVSYDPRYEDDNPLKIKIIRIKKEDVQTRVDEAMHRIAYLNVLIDSGDINAILNEE